MVRLVTVVLILAVISCVIAAPTEVRRKEPIYKLTASNGSISVGHVMDSEFGDGSFSIIHGGKSSGKGDGATAATLAPTHIIMAAREETPTTPATERRKKTHPRCFVIARRGSISVGGVTGGKFGKGSFSVSHDGNSSGKDDGSTAATWAPTHMAARGETPTTPATERRKKTHPRCILIATGGSISIEGVTGGNFGVGSFSIGLSPPNRTPNRLATRKMSYFD